MQLYFYPSEYSQLQTAVFDSHLCKANHTDGNKSQTGPQLSVYMNKLYFNNSIFPQLKGNDPKHDACGTPPMAMKNYIELQKEKYVLSAGSQLSIKQTDSCTAVYHDS